MQIEGRALRIGGSYSKVHLEHEDRRFLFRAQCGAVVTLFPLKSEIVEQYQKKGFCKLCAKHLSRDVLNKIEKELTYQLI